MPDQLYYTRPIHDGRPQHHHDGVVNSHRGYREVAPPTGYEREDDYDEDRPVSRHHDHYQPRQHEQHGRRRSDESPAHRREERHHQPARRENPVVHVLRGTYEAWDDVLVGVGKAWYKMGGK